MLKAFIYNYMKLEVGQKVEKKKSSKTIFFTSILYTQEAVCIIAKKSLLKMKGNRITLSKIKQYFVTLNPSLGFRSSNKKCSKHSVEF